MATWTKKNFESVGVTEHPAGEGLDALQRLFSGAVVLALDVSGSMEIHDAGPDHDVQRLAQAVQGCCAFVTEAVDAHYAVGVILWNHDVMGSVPPASDPQAALTLLAGAVTNGGNDAVPFLELAHRMLLRTGSSDMVVAIFGDGDLGDPGAASTKAHELADDGIRILTCGLGEHSAETLAAISTEASAPRVAASDSIAESIASMARGLKRTGTGK